MKTHLSKLNELKPRAQDSGFTLIEMIMVIVLLGVISGIAAVRLESVGMWKKKDDLRSFAATWETLFNEAVATQYGFQLVIDLDEQNYYALQEIPNRSESSTVQVDYLENLRIKSQQERLEKEKLEESRKNLENQIAEVAEFESGDLEKQYYAAIFADPFQAASTSPPLDFPSLAEKKYLSSGLRIKDVKIMNEKIEEGSAIIRFSPQGSSTFAVVHFELEEGEASFTLIMNPSTGRVTTLPNYVDYEWSLGKNDKE